VKPLLICQTLGSTHVDAYFGELSGKEVRALLLAGKISPNVPATAYTQSARRQIWRRRFEAELAQKNEGLALGFLLEWLMRHHRSMLVDYLDFLGVKHTMGETDEDFCATREVEQLHAGAEALFEKYPRHEVATYLLLIGHMQETPVFDRMSDVLVALGMDEATAAAHAAAQADAPAKAS